jgi:dipeptidyl aminopeptidase/acylaminoacyl peptidase
MLNLMISALAFTFFWLSHLTASDLSIWTPTELMNFKNITDIQISPDQHRVLFTYTEANLDEGKNSFTSKIYRTNLTDPSHPVLFSSPQFSSFKPRWSPDGKWIAFLSNRTGKTHLYLISSHGGEAIALTQGDNPVEGFKWSPDSKEIAFVMADTSLEKPIKSNTIIYKKDYLIKRLWLAAIDAPFKAAPLTSDAYNLMGREVVDHFTETFDWSPDGRWIAFTYTHDSEMDSYHLCCSIAILDLEYQNCIPLEHQIHYAAYPRFSPDGKKIAYMGCDGKPTHLYDRRIKVFFLDRASEQMLAPTFNEGPTLYESFFLEWTADNQKVMFYEPKHTKAHIALLPLDGSPSLELPIGEVLVRCPVLSQDRKLLSFVMETPSSPPEAYVTYLDKFQPKQVSFVNKNYLSHPFPKTEVIQWKSSNGWMIEGLLTYPLKYDPSKKYPLALVLHGGPASAFSETFLGHRSTYPLLSFSEAGFFIFRPNPRGSNGYGKTFRSAILHDWGGKDFDDIMSGVETLISEQKVDPERMGIMGWSYGGYMTAWAITQTPKFKAASIGAGMVHLNSMLGTTDIPCLLLDYLGDPSQNTELYSKRSPINYASGIKTPCLIQHGLMDLRVNASQADEWYHALKRYGKTPILLIYPDCSHDFRTPRSEFEAMQANFKWFDKHLSTRDPIQEPIDPSSLLE